MDIKSLTFRQIRLAQELSRYHFQIDYRQGKANATADSLWQVLQRSHGEEVELRAENTQFYDRLQSSLPNTSLSRLSLSGHTTGS